MLIASSEPQVPSGRVLNDSTNTQKCHQRWNRGRKMQPYALLHLTALGNDEILYGFLGFGSRVFDFANNIHAIYDLSKDNMLVVKEWSRNGGNKELTTIGIWTGVLDQSQGLFGTLELSKRCLQPYLVIRRSHVSD